MSEEPVVVTRCRRCSRRLTDPESVKRKIGPVCKKKLEQAQKLDEYLDLDSGEEYHEHYEREELCHLTGDECIGDPMFCEECPVMVPQMEEPETTLPTCPRCGKESPNPNYCISCGAPIKAKALEVAAA